MPREAKPTRLWFRPPRRKKGRIIEQGVWLILDRGKQISTGCGKGENIAAQTALGNHIAEAHRPPKTERDLAAVPVPDVISLYIDEVVNETTRPEAGAARCDSLLDFWGEKTLANINEAECKKYAKERGSESAARRDLEDLSAAVGLHAKKGYHRGIVKFWLPPKSKSRVRWLTRDEVARLIWACWRYREWQTVHCGPNKGAIIFTPKHPLRHVARFILLGVYTGTRAGAIASASYYAASGRSYVDTSMGVFFRLKQGARETNKRQPPVALPDRLLAHLRRWKAMGEALRPGIQAEAITSAVVAAPAAGTVTRARRNGASTGALAALATPSDSSRPLPGQFVVEWNGKPVKSVKKGFRRGVDLAKLDESEGRVTPHTLRHTAATWLMQRGVSYFDASNYLGMSPKTLKETYGHHHPEFQRVAVNAITRKPPRVVTLSRTEYREAK